MKVRARVGLALAVFAIGAMTVDACGTATTTSNVAHLGCSQYCRTAGGYGGDDTNPKVMLRLATGAPVRPLPDGTIPLRFTCLFTSECLGTVFIDSVSGRFTNIDHGSDIQVSGNAGTRTIAVPLPSAALAELNKGASFDVYVSADLGRSFCPQLRDPKTYNCFPHNTISLGKWRALELDTWKIRLAAR